MAQLSTAVTQKGAARTSVISREGGTSPTEQAQLPSRVAQHLAAQGTAGTAKRAQGCVCCVTWHLMGARLGCLHRQQRSQGREEGLTLFSWSSGQGCPNYDPGAQTSF